MTHRHRVWNMRAAYELAYAFLYVATLMIADRNPVVVKAEPTTPTGQHTPLLGPGSVSAPALGTPSSATSQVVELVPTSSVPSAVVPPGLRTGGQDSSAVSDCNHTDDTTTGNDEDLNDTQSIAVQPIAGDSSTGNQADSTGQWGAGSCPSGSGVHNSDRVQRSEDAPGDGMASSGTATPGPCSSVYGPASPSGTASAVPPTVPMPSSSVAMQVPVEEMPVVQEVPTAVAGGSGVGSAPTGSSRVCSTPQPLDALRSALVAPPSLPSLPVAVHAATLRGQALEFDSDSTAGHAAALAPDATSWPGVELDADSATGQATAPGSDAAVAVPVTGSIATAITADNGTDTAQPTDAAAIGAFDTAATTTSLAAADTATAASLTAADTAAATSLAPACSSPSTAPSTPSQRASSHRRRGAGELTPAYVLHANPHAGRGTNNTALPCKTTTVVATAVQAPPSAAAAKRVESTRRLYFILPSDFFEGTSSRRRLYRILGLRIRREFKLGRYVVVLVRFVSSFLSFCAVVLVLLCRRSGPSEPLLCYPNPDGATISTSCRRQRPPRRK